MMTARLALFDCDGTLADSQHHIVAAMNEAFAAIGLAPPAAPAVRQVIGLSLPGIAATLLPDGDDAQRDALVAAYRDAYFRARSAAGAAPEPLFDGIVSLLDQLAAAGWTLGIATGKSRRGLDRLLGAHGIAERFATLQTADGHPSKPHPAMVHAALAETGVAAADTIVIGDTAFDLLMAEAAGARGIGVAWGYHAAAELRAAGAIAVADNPAALAVLMEAL